MADPKPQPKPGAKPKVLDPSSVHSAAFEARVQAAIQASAWALTPVQLPMVGRLLTREKGAAPMDAMGRKQNTMLVVETKAFYTPAQGTPSSLENRQAVMRHGFVQLERAALLLHRGKDLAYSRHLPPAPRKVWAALVSEEKVPGLDLLAEAREEFLFLGAFSYDQFVRWLANEDEV